MKNLKIFGGFLILSFFLGFIGPPLFFIPAVVWAFDNTDSAIEIFSAIVDIFFGVCLFLGGCIVLILHIEKAQAVTFKEWKTTMLEGAVSQAQYENVWIKNQAFQDFGGHTAYHDFLEKASKYCVEQYKKKRTPVRLCMEEQKLRWDLAVSRREAQYRDAITKRNQKINRPSGH